VLWRLNDWRIEAAGSEFEYSRDLFARDWELLPEFLDGHTVFQIFEPDGNGHVRSLENPRTASTTGHPGQCSAIIRLSLLSATRILCNMAERLMSSPKLLGD
jgi:hypothetical protein